MVILELLLIIYSLLFTFILLLVLAWHSIAVISVFFTG